jgi:hypothetical protein
MVELESKGELTRSEVAVFLREFAAELDAGLFEQQPEQGQARERNREDPAEGEAIDSKRITLIVGGNSATVTVPKAVDFESGSSPAPRCSVPAPTRGSNSTSRGRSRTRTSRAATGSKSSSEAIATRRRNEASQAAGTARNFSGVSTY